MCGLTVHTSRPTALAWQGVILPRCIPTTKESLRALLWNLQSGGFPSPAPWTGPCHAACRGMTSSPPREPSALPWKPIDRCFGGGIDQRAFMPLGTQTGAFAPRTTSRGSALHPDGGRFCPLDPGTIFVG